MSLIAYVWALELAIKGLVAKSEGFAAKPIVKRVYDCGSSISSIHGKQSLDPRDVYPMDRREGVEAGHF